MRNLLAALAPLSCVSSPAYTGDKTSVKFTATAECQAFDIDLIQDAVELITPWLPDFDHGNIFSNYTRNIRGACQAVLDADTHFKTAVTAIKMAAELGQKINRPTGKPAK